MISTQLTSSPSSTHARRTQRTLLALFVGIVGFGVAGACNNTTDPGKTLGFAGTYELVSVNTAPLPYHVPDSNTFVVRGSITIHNSPRYDLIETDSAAGVTSNVNSSGVWSVTSNALSLRSDDGAFYLGIVVGNRDTVRIQLGTHLGTYARQ